jgi:hydrogenase maturation protease
MMPDLDQTLRRCLRGRVCLMGLGNPAHGDDGFGVHLARALAPQPGTGTEETPLVLVAGTMPDRLVGRIAAAGYEHIVFMDAADIGGAPGAVAFLDSAQMAARFPQVSTHGMSLGLLARWAEQGGATRAWLLGAQPQCLRPAQRLTPVLQVTLQALAAVLRGLWGSLKTEDLARTAPPSRGPLEGSA